MSIDPVDPRKIPVNAITLATLSIGEITAEKIAARSVTPAMLPIGAISVGHLNPKEPEHG